MAIKLTIADGCMSVEGLPDVANEVNLTATQGNYSVGNSNLFSVYDAVYKSEYDLGVSTDILNGNDSDNPFVSDEALKTYLKSFFAKAPATGGSIAQTVVVAESGGEFTSLKAACDSITDASITKPYSIQLYAGVYTEAPFTVPAFVEVIGYNAELKPSNNAADFITLLEESELKGCKVVPPTSAKGVILSGLNAKYKDGTVEGACVCGIEVSGLRAVIRDVNVDLATKGLCVVAGGGATGDAVAFIGCTTGIETQGDGSLLASSFAAISCTVDLKMLGTSTVELTASKLNLSKFEIADWDKLKLSANSDQEDDEALINLQELQVGAAEKGYETVLGEGDSYTRGMLCYTETELNAFTDKTAEARSASGSTLSFPGIVADNAIYLASTLQNASDVLKFFGAKTKINTAAVYGAGEIVIEYWSGAAWTELNGMECDAGDKYFPHAKNYFQETGSHHIRFDSFLCNDNWTKNDPMTLGASYYWVRFRIKTAITTAPVFEQFKLHTSRLEVNADGFTEYFGKARPIGRLNWDIDVLEKAATNPGDQDLYLGDNLDVGGKKNQFKDGEISRIGFKTVLPLDCDTSSKIKFSWAVITDDASGDDIDFVVRHASNKDGDNVYVSAPGGSPANLRTYAASLPAPVAANTVKWYTTDLDISDMLAERENGFPDTIWLTIERNGSTDSHDGDVAMVVISANYKKWREGGHI